MESSSSCSLVEKIKRKIFSSNVDPYTYICPSAYDTAWLAMIPDSHDPSKPMFKNCLHWLINNQNEQGFWGDCDASAKPSWETLPATLASMVALKKWNTGALLIQRGLSFIEANTEKLLKDIENCCPCWFIIVFPAMVRLSECAGIEIVFPDTVTETMSSIFLHQQKILDKEELVGKNGFSPLLSYLEALPPWYKVSEEDIFSNLSGDGSLFQSPSATAKAFMLTGNIDSLGYLESLIQRCPNGVPQTYPMDEDLIKLCMINQLQRLGLAEHFDKEIGEILAKIYRQIYRKYVEQEWWVKPTNMAETQLHKDSLAFQLLRMHGYNVSASLSFGWFLDDEEIRANIEKESEHMSTTILSMYRASNLIFCGENELEDVKSFTRDLLHKCLLTKNGEPNTILSQFQQMVQHELNTHWLDETDHLKHRTWIENYDTDLLWKGKTSHVRISHFHNVDLLELAVQNYELKQSIFRHELKELTRWVKDNGVTKMGFGREKTTYCYYSIAAATTYPNHSYIRTLVAKSAILITIADDFFDKEGSLRDLKHFTNAIRRWDSKGLNGHGKVIFNALDNLISETATKYLEQGGIHDIKSGLQDLWCETFLSWLEEAKWNKKGQPPTIDDYLKNAMLSIAIHTMILPASCFLNPTFADHNLRPPQYETVTKLLMFICRILNDIQSYKRETEEGKWNFVQLSLMMNPNLKMEDSIAEGREIIDEMTKEFLQHVLVDGESNLPKPCKLLHLTCLKVFHMFYNSSNAFDSDTQLLEDISNAFYLPLRRTTKPSNTHLSQRYSVPKMKGSTMQKLRFGGSFKLINACTSFGLHQPALGNPYGIIALSPKPLIPCQFI
ncbi:(E,E)-geranyllinalool synthase isoform X1 [Vigna radiata var. radiata]|uniref:(E,E)-geranyllinalool synthase isoform X1 n=1 Tax=Vigna radiata var. radiata TaxID=3916 RepID=A0A1S3UKP5_VIGRR|nr:(E,E)-geranyllinalool synthase isoform X1 [Vigna radiata var. radiata]